MSNSKQSDSEQNLKQLLFDGLNEHGFLFQEKCADVIRSQASKTKWQVIETEYPVSTELRDTRIDIVLRDFSPSQDIRVYAIVECKRVNPTRGYWLFGKPTSKERVEALILELRGKYSNAGNYSIRYALPKTTFTIALDTIDNWWLQISKQGKGKKTGASPQPIEDTLIQVCTGVSGMAQQLELQWNKDPQELTVYFVPIVLTTAPLYYAEYDLKDIELSSGNISQNKIYFGPKGKEPEDLPWFLVNYPASSSTATIVNINEYATTGINKGLIENYARSVFVVNADYIPDFFQKFHRF